jgi:hypothetical protein
MVKFIDKQGLSENKHCDNRATNANCRMLEAEWRQVLQGSMTMGPRKMSQALGTLGLLDITML